MPQFPATVEVLAPAKINLTLHVTGRRSDGYHLLDSLVVFAGVGDKLTLSSADALSLTVAGPCADAVPRGDDNLVLRAARLFDPVPRAAISLEKNLPAEAGIGGGSADAAATLRALARMLDRPLPDAQQIVLLGADVPVCLSCTPARMRGIGDRVEPISDLPPLWLVLINPGVAAPTPEVYRALRTRDNPPMTLPERPLTAHAFCDWLSAQRNDLQTGAATVAPAISDCLSALALLDGCRVARMSGSGATCFGVFTDAGAAKRAAEDLRRTAGGWWVVDAPVLGPAIS